MVPWVAEKGNSVDEARLTKQQRTQVDRLAGRVPDCFGARGSHERQLSAFFVRTKR